jgi:hypothetical protein
MFNGITTPTKGCHGRTQNKEYFAARKTNLVETSMDHDSDKYQSSDFEFALS